MQQPIPTQQPSQFQQSMPLSKKNLRKRLWLILTAVILVLAVIIGLASCGQDQQSEPTTQDTQQAQPIQTPAPQSANYPPTTEADLHGLAAEGDASAINEFHSESVGAVGVCPQPRIEVTVDPSITGQQLAEDLLAYFYANQLDNPCGSLVLAYHNQSEANDVYTAGRISFDVTDSSGAGNLDPNATNLKYTLTLDIGGDLSNPQQYTITY